MESYCKQCGTVGDPAKIKRWPLAITFILSVVTFVSFTVLLEAIRLRAYEASGQGLLLFIGLLLATLGYAAFRNRMAYHVCDACGSREIIPADSPLAKAQQHS
jgi:hypothetical protein